MAGDNHSDHHGAGLAGAGSGHACQYQRGIGGNPLWRPASLREATDPLAGAGIGGSIWFVHDRLPPVAPHCGAAGHLLRDSPVIIFGGCAMCLSKRVIFLKDLT